MERKNHIKASEFNSEIRAGGVLIRALCPYFSLSFMKLINRCMNLFFPKSFKMKGIAVNTLFIEREDGSNLRVLEVKSEKKESGKALLYLHGGGYAFGSPVQDKKKIARFVTECGAAVYAPFYTLSVQKPFPAALDDCYLALKYASSLSHKNISVCGSSAGGGLATSLSQMALDKGEIEIKAVMPIYPMIDDRFTPSNRCCDAPLWNTRSNITAWKLYLGPYYQTDCVPPYAAAARRENLSGLPMTVCYIGTLDPFFSETKNYMDRLEKSGVKVHFKVIEGAYHAFDMFSRTEIAKSALSFMYETYNEITEE